MPFGSTKVSNLEALATDLALALGVEDVFVKRMPGESSVAVFVPNKERRWVDFKDTVKNVWNSYVQWGSTTPRLRVPLNLGVDYLGKPVVDDLSEMPHILVAGSTGVGKSTWLHSVIASLIYVTKPAAVRLVLSDTKQVEFRHFIGAPHLLFEPAWNVYRTLEQLDWCIEEMDHRLKTFGEAGCHNIHEFNSLAAVQSGTSAKLGQPRPYIVIVIDELYDLVCNDEKGESDSGDKRKLGKIAEGKIGKIVQKARAAGVYLIAATQRPSVDVVKGSIKANFPARLAFRLPSDHDSRTVLSGQGGAEHLLSKGDMLFSSPTRPGLLRLHAPYTSNEDIKAAIEMAKRSFEMLQS